jgi:hypothetical protein
MEHICTFILYALDMVLTVSLRQEKTLEGEPNHSCVPHGMGNKIKKNVKFQTKYKF